MTRIAVVWLFAWAPSVGAAPRPVIDPPKLRNTYYVLRHGQSRGNLAGVIKSGLRALLGCGLTRKG